MTIRTGTGFLLPLAAALVLCGAALPALAQGQALSLLPQDQPASRPTWSLFSTIATPAPSPAPEPETATETDEMPDASKAAGNKDGGQKTWKRVNVPLPPIPDRPRATAAAGKAGTGNSTGKDTGKDISARTAEPGKATAEIESASPPQPRATGLFAALFTAAPAPQGADTASGSDGGIARPAYTPITPEIEGHFRQEKAKATRIDLTDPFRPRNLPGPGEAEDDLDSDDNPAGVTKQVASVSIACLKPRLLEMIRKTGEHFGATPVITSGHRARGRRGSLHRTCEAADFIIPGVETDVLAAFLRKMPGAGGVGTYCHTKSVHLDTGEARDWRYCGFSRRFALRTPVVAGSGPN